MEKVCTTINAWYIYVFKCVNSGIYVVWLGEQDGVLCEVILAQCPKLCEDAQGNSILCNMQHNDELYEVVLQQFNTFCKVLSAQSLCLN